MLLVRKLSVNEQSQIYWGLKWGLPCDPYPWCIGQCIPPQVFSPDTISDDSPTSPTPSMIPQDPTYPVLVTSSGHHWRTVQAHLIDLTVQIPQQPTTRMHSSRMCTVCCSGHLSCHACLLPCMPPPLCHACPPPCTPHATHAPCHAHLLLCTPPTMHAPLPCIPPAMHTLTVMHALLPHMSPCYTCPPCHVQPPLDRMTDACEGITFSQLLLRTVMSGNWSNRYGRCKWAVCILLGCFLQRSQNYLIGFTFREDPVDHFRYHYHPIDCSKYIFCNGPFVIEQSCPASLVYDLPRRFCTTIDNQPCAECNYAFTYMLRYQNNYLQARYIILLDSFVPS